MENFSGSVGNYRNLKLQTKNLLLYRKGMAISSFQWNNIFLGHNMVLDICHTLNQFCAPLPLEYADFKDMTGTVFPNILDTKVCSSVLEVPRVTLR